jgi:hypothetical protein
MSVFETNYVFLKSNSGIETLNFVFIASWCYKNPFATAAYCSNVI